MPDRQAQRGGGAGGGPGRGDPRCVPRERAVDIERGNDAEGEFVEIQARVAALQDPLLADDRLALARRAVALGLAVGDREMQAWGRLWSMDVYAANGRRGELLGELAALTVLAEQLGPAWQSRVLLVRASQALLDGRFDDVVRLAEEAARSVESTATRRSCGCRSHSRPRAIRAR